ncbi:hypothetical protein HYV82_02415 [Candidatus Woesearchaeota archaeon]|nr:hypothetical protein [Candidatus Woesearchaeota archaeon]
MIRKKVPDIAKARSMIAAARIDMGFIESVPVSREASQSIIRGVYENFRILGDALLTAQGFEASGSDHHAEMIDAIVRLQIKTPRSLMLLHEIRKLRHRINYIGYIPSEEEAEYVLSIKKALWKPVLAEAEKLVLSKN